MVLGNTFHLFIQPGHELIAELGGLHEFMGWERRDHHRLGRLPGLLDGPRVGGRGDQAPRATPRKSMVVSIEEEGVRFRSYLDGARALHGPGDLDGGPGRARLGHRARVRRVHALPRRARLHGGARWSARTAGSTAASTWHGEHAPPGQLLYGIVQGGVYEDLRARVDRVRGAARASTASRSAARSGRRRSRCARWWAGRCAGLPDGAAAPPARDRRRGRHRPRGRRGHRHLRLRDAHAPGAPRHRARPRPGAPLAARPHQERAPHEPRADRRATAPARPAASTRAPTCTTWSGSDELTGKRLLTLHNLTFMERLMRRLRDAIGAGALRGRGASGCSAGVRLDEVAQPVDLLLNVGLLDRVHARRCPTTTAARPPRSRPPR